MKFLASMEVHACTPLKPLDCFGTDDPAFSVGSPCCTGKLAASPLASLHCVACSRLCTTSAIRASIHVASSRATCRSVTSG